MRAQPAVEQVQAHLCPRQRFCRRRAIDFKGHTYHFSLTAAGLSGIPSEMDF
jgi:hypothetical protein